MRLPKPAGIPADKGTDELYLRRVLSDVKKTGAARIGFDGTTYKEFETEVLRIAQSMHMSNVTCHRAMGGQRILIKYEPPPEKQKFDFEALQAVGDNAEFEVPRNRERYFRSKASQHASSLGLSSRVERPKIGTLCFTLIESRATPIATPPGEAQAPRRPQSKYQFETLCAVGDSILLEVPRQEHTRVRLSASGWASRYAMKLRCNAEGDAIRVTRIT